MDDERRSTSLYSGDEVVFENTWLHERSPDIYPKVGTHGIVLEVFPSDSLYEAVIQWDRGSTSEDDIWCVLREDVSVYKKSSINRSGFDIAYLYDK